MAAKLDGLMDARLRKLKIEADESPGSPLASVSGCGGEADSDSEADRQSLADADIDKSMADGSAGEILLVHMTPDEGLRKLQASPDTEQDFDEKVIWLHAEIETMTKMTPCCLHNLNTVSLR